MPIPRQFLLAPRQTCLVDDDSFWPTGYLEEFAAVLEAHRDEERLSAKLTEICRRAAEELTADAIAEPHRALREETAERTGFEARLEARWGRGLDLADLVVSEAFESGRWANDVLRPAAAARQDHKFEALIRLHGKAVMTAREVMVLLRSGFSSGALARWRTLHEVWVVFLLLADGNAELSRRYLAHDEVESIKGQKEYEEIWEALRFEPPDWTPQEREQAEAELAEEFGRPFLQGYGWAALLFDDKAPKFKQLQEGVDLDHWRGFYRMASHGTHANSKGTYWNIQSPEPIDVVWAGPSNAGLVDPAQCTLTALADITASLVAYAASEIPESADIDTLAGQFIIPVRQHVIFHLTDRAIQEFAQVHDQQEAEEEAMSELISRATDVLQDGAPMTAEKLSAELNVKIEDLQEALDAAATRGDLFQETHFHTGAPDTSIGTQAPRKKP